MGGRVGPRKTHSGLLTGTAESEAPTLPQRRGPYVQVLAETNGKFCWHPQVFLRQHFKENCIPGMQPWAVKKLWWCLFKSKAKFVQVQGQGWGLMGKRAQSSPARMWSGEVFVLISSGLSASPHPALPSSTTSYAKRACGQWQAPTRPWALGGGGDALGLVHYSIPHFLVFWNVYFFCMHHQGHTCNKWILPRAAAGVSLPSTPHPARHFILWTPHCPIRVQLCDNF